MTITQYPFFQSGKSCCQPALRPTVQACRYPGLAGHQVQHPNIWFLVAPYVVLTIHPHRLEGAGNHVQPALRESQTRPAFPIPDARFDCKRFRRDTQRSGAQTPVDANPEVVWRPVGPLPGAIAVHRYQRITLFPNRSGGRNQPGAATGHAPPPEPVPAPVSPCVIPADAGIQYYIV
jgi:hypothetical protein